MLSFFTDTSTPSKKVVLTLITALLWLTMLILGVVALDAANDIIHSFYLLNVAGQIESKTSAGGIFTLLQIGVFFFGGLALVILTIGGTFIFKHIGEVRVIKFLGWTILIEVFIIILNLVL